MVIKMNRNRIIFYITILLIIFMLSVPSVMKTIDKHNERLLGVTIGEIVEKAKSCYYNESCVGDTITLAELYEKTDLIELTNPITKKIYNSESYVDVNDNFNFVEIKE